MGLIKGIEHSLRIKRAYLTVLDGLTHFDAQVKSFIKKT